MRLLKTAGWTLLILLAVALAAPAFASEAETAPEEMEEITIEFLHIYGNHREKFDAMVSAFEEQNPGVTVEQSEVHWSEVMNLLQTSLATGDMPDVTFMWGSQQANWVNLGASLGLGEYIYDDQEFLDALVSPSVLDSGSFDGEPHNIPFRGTGTFLVYNMAILDDLGIAIPETLEELEAAMATIAAAGIIPMSTAAKPTEANRLLDVMMTWMRYEADKLNLFETDLYRRGRNFELPYTPALERLANWFDQGWLDPSCFALTVNEDDQLFVNGDSAISIQNNNHRPTLERLVEETEADVEMYWDMFPAPADASRYIQWGTFDGWFVSAQTEHPEIAAEFLKFLAVDPAVAAIWNTGGEQSLLVARGAGYDSPDVARMAPAMAYMTSYRVTPDYAVGNQNPRIGSVLAEFILQGEKSAQEVSGEINDMYRTLAEEFDASN